MPAHLIQLIFCIVPSVIIFPVSDLPFTLKATIWKSVTPNDCFQVVAYLIAFVHLHINLIGDWFLLWLNSTELGRGLLYFMPAWIFEQRVLPLDSLHAISVSYCHSSELCDILRIWCSICMLYSFHDYTIQQTDIHWWVILYYYDSQHMSNASHVPLVSSSASNFVLSGLSYLSYQMVSNTFFLFNNSSCSNWL